MGALLSLEDVSFSYGEGIPALCGLNVSIAEGERIAVLGNNGAGKSTFFLCCNGVLHPEQGSIRLCGEKIGGGRKELTRLRRAVGLVFQDSETQLLAGSVEEEVSFGPMNLRLPEEEVVRRVEEALERFDLQALRRRAPQELSGGEKKRVTLADVLAMHPRLLLLDEPAASLDPQNTSLLEQNLAALSEAGLTLMIATHDMDFAWRWAERILLFHAGRLAADGVPAVIFSDEALLARCGLHPPMLFRIGKALRLPSLPRTVEELEGMLGTGGAA